MVPVCGELICCVCWDGVGVQGLCGVSTARRRLHKRRLTRTSGTKARACRAACSKRSGVVVLVVPVVVVVVPAEDATAADQPAVEAARAEHLGAVTPHGLVPAVTVDTELVTSHPKTAKLEQPT